MTWLKDNWEFIAIFAGGIGTFWTFISDKLRERLSRPFAKQKETIEVNSDKIELEKENIDLQIKWQQFQNDRVEYAMKKYEDFKRKSDTHISEMQDILDYRDEIINEYKEQSEIDKVFLKKHRMHIKYLENLLKDNNIQHEKLKDE